MSKNPVVLEITIPSDIKLLSMLGDLVEVFLQKCLNNGSDISDLAFQMNLALTEASSNAILHGCKNNPEHYVKVKLELIDDSLTLEVSDNGSGFDLEAVSTPEPYQDKGRGLFIIKQLMDSVEYKVSDEETKFVMHKKIVPQSKAS
jgi:serine/threonine-protein kinase RsbW